VKEALHTNQIRSPEMCLKVQEYTGQATSAVSRVPN